MDTRKNYVAPAIAAEDMLEQTSLACHATQPPPMLPLFLASECSAGVAQPVPFAPGVGECGIDVSKGGAFYGGGNGIACENPVLGDVVVLS